MLRVTNVQKAVQAPCIVNINPYAPISFRSRSQPIGGARYIQLGNSKTQLLELQFPPESLVLSGFTLVLAGASAQGALAGDGPTTAGLPIISLSQGEAFSGIDRIPQLDIQTNVAVSCVNRQAEVRLGAAETFNRRIVHGRVQFLLSEDVLVGVRVLDLTEKERQILDEYIAQHPHQGN